MTFAAKNRLAERDIQTQQQILAAHGPAPRTAETTPAEGATTSTEQMAEQFIAAKAEFPEDVVEIDVAEDVFLTETLVVV